MTRWETKQSTTVPRSRNLPRLYETEWQAHPCSLCSPLCTPQPLMNSRTRLMIAGHGNKDVCVTLIVSSYRCSLHMSRQHTASRDYHLCISPLTSSKYYVAHVRLLDPSNRTENLCPLYLTKETVRSMPKALFDLIT